MAALGMIRLGAPRTRLLEALVPLFSRGQAEKTPPKGKPAPSRPREARGRLGAEMSPHEAGAVMGAGDD
jgi:hypothetical protein